MSTASAEDEWRAALRGALARSVKPELVRALLDGQQRPVADLSAFEQGIGLTGLALPAGRGGGGGTLRELAIAFEELGKVLYPGPCLASTLALAVLDKLGAAELITAIVGGTQVGLAFGAGPGAPDVTAVSGPDGWLLRGRSEAALDCGHADVILVRATASQDSASQASASQDSASQGSAVFAVRQPRPECTSTELPTMDPTRPAWELTFGDCPADLISADGDLAWARFDLLGAFLTAAEAAGGARACLDRAVSYAKERVQFGRPIGQYQAIKHQCADMLVQCEAAALAVQSAADALAAGEDPGSDDGLLDSAQVAVSVAKAYAGQAFYRCAATSLHIFGGRGFLWEDDAHLYFRRAVTTMVAFGDVARHHEIIASALAATAGAATAGAAQ